MNPADISQEGVDLTKVTFEQYLKHTEATIAKEQSASVPAEGVKGKQPEEVVHEESGDADDESTETEPEIDMATSSFSTPRPPESQSIPESGESSQPKKTVLPDPFEGFPNIHGELKDDFVLGEDFDMFHDASVKALEKKVSILEKEKSKAKADRDEMKKQLEELMKVNEEIKSVMIKQAKKLKKMEGEVDDITKLFELLSAEVSDLHVKNVKLNKINKTLNQLISELHEASGNEFKAINLEIEALRADKVMKD
ncbi:hypothetical protein Hanom_Chr11g01014211 [Helianthus anomalus]